MSDRDKDRQQVYEAEFAVRDMLDSESDTVVIYGSHVSVPAERRFGDIESIQTYVDKVLEHVGKSHNPLKVRVRKGLNKAHYSPVNAEIAIPNHKWAMREIVVLHEIAHHLSSSEGGPHGPDFRSVFCGLLEQVLGPEARFMLQVCYGERGLSA